MTGTTARDPGEVAVTGFAEGRFAPLEDVFARLVTTLDGAGAALCVYDNGRPVVDLTGGSYRPDSLQLLFSVSKAVTAVATGIAVDSGRLDLDRPLAACWPEFDRTEVSGITLRTVMSHRSGLAGLTGPVTFADLLAGRDRELVAEQQPFWPPDHTHGYHAFTFGSLVDGVFRRTLGVSVSDVVRDEVAAPLGLDLWIGTPAEQQHRIEPVLFLEPATTPLAAERGRSGEILPDTAFGALFAEPDVFNSAGMRGAGWPAVSGVSSARSLARMMAATLGPVDGVRYFSSSTRDDLVRTRSRGVDRVLGVPLHYGTGFQRPFPQLPMLGPTSYGHEAAGGSLVVADVDSGLSFAFTTNRFGHLPGANPAALAIAPSVLHCATSSETSTDRPEFAS